MNYVFVYSVECGGSAGFKFLFPTSLFFLGVVQLSFSCVLFLLKKKKLKKIIIMTK